jgi:DNA processing protein
MYIQTPAFLTPFEARAILFSCIEPGHFFWSAEISVHGPLKVLESILSASYPAEKTKSIIDAIRVAEVGQILNEIEKAGAKFLTPEHEHWPIGVNQLVNPPIGLIVKGDSTSLITDSLAIVGSRKPTNYGANVASGEHMELIPMPIVQLFKQMEERLQFWLQGLKWPIRNRIKNYLMR